ncbi:hypothetical protein N7539_003553 [Penicillium diatomitis]|uniref:L-type lectin-like domain-containing protein n=1 Tax=Penicillium diatomitis TaxID=2819901 RepID=A0A9W9XD38_9EURO|nr:uncharacterized protein N7539_003553 [Penicillium diatomitis]KAJ5488663.1 hypothetical protein N7539_003553 [Penicillium diatomitis]
MRCLSTLTFFAIGATAQVIEGTSFGHGTTLTSLPEFLPIETQFRVGAWGERVTYQFFCLQLSDKVILTPPYPGNTRGSAWAQNPVSQQEWSAEFQFRASGPERAGGIMQLWYAKDGQTRVGTSSIYTVGPFDGFALVVDTHGGRGGSVRGFLNDGTVDYKSHRSVDSLAFGHCNYAYRNLGRPSSIKVKHTNSVFEVTVDDKVCFSTGKINLPTGNTFGLTAATPETPDSFEVFKFILTSGSGQGQTAQSPQDSTQQQQQHIVNHNQVPVGGDSKTSGSDSSNAAQFVELHSRIQLQNKAINNIIQEMKAQAGKTEARHNEAMQKLVAKEQIATLDARLQRIESLLQNIQRDLEGKDYSGRFNQLQDTLRSSHLSLTENLQSHFISAITASTPRMGFFIFLVIAFQALLATAYVIYKRRRANMPKKFL